MAAPPPASSASSVVKGDSKTRHCGPPFAGATVQCINIQSGVKVWTADVNPLAIYDPLTSTLPIKKRDLAGLPGAFTLSNVLSPEECDKFISIVETMGFEPAKVTTMSGAMVLSSIRNNERVIWQTPLAHRQRRGADAAAAAAAAAAAGDPSAFDYLEELYLRIADFVPAKTSLDGEDFTPCGLNERLRFYKYDAGAVFQTHTDGMFVRDRAEVSIFTVIIYLSDDTQLGGGETTFFRTLSTPLCSVPPIRGSCLIFPHGAHPDSPLHEGSLVTNGTKHVLRTDMMCCRASERSKVFPAQADEADKGTLIPHQTNQ